MKLPEDGTIKYRPDSKERGLPTKESGGPLTPGVRPGDETASDDSVVESLPSQEDRGPLERQIIMVPDEEGTAIGRSPSQVDSPRRDQHLALVIRSALSSLQSESTGSLISRARNYNSQLLSSVSTLGPCQQAAMAETLLSIYGIIEQRITEAQRAQGSDRPNIPGIDWGHRDDPLGGALLDSISPFGMYMTWGTIARTQAALCSAQAQEQPPERRRTRPSRQRQPDPPQPPPPPQRDIPDPPHPPSESDRELYLRDRAFLCSRLERGERRRLSELANEGTFVKWYLHKINVCNITPNLPTPNTRLGRMEFTFTSPDNTALSALRTLLRTQLSSGEGFTSRHSTRYLTRQWINFGNTIRAWHRVMTIEAPQQGENGYNFMYSLEWAGFCDFIEHYRPDIDCEVDTHHALNLLRRMNNVQPPQGLNAAIRAISIAATRFTLAPRSRRESRPVSVERPLRILRLN